MNGTIAAFGSSESADSSGDLLQSSDDTVETAITSDDDQPLVEIPRSSKLCRIEKTCPFKCSQEGFVVCIYCRKAVINADGCKAHILKFHKTEGWGGRIAVFDTHELPHAPPPTAAKFASLWDDLAGANKPATPANLNCRRIPVIRPDENMLAKQQQAPNCSSIQALAATS